VTEQITRQQEPGWNRDVLDALELLREAPPVPDGMEQRIVEAALEGQRRTRPSVRVKRPNWLMWPVGVAASFMAVALGILSGLEAADSLRSQDHTYPSTSGSPTDRVIALEDPFSLMPQAHDWLGDLALVIPEDHP